MAKYQFTGPDGGTYQIEAPDDVPSQDIMDFVGKQFQGAKPSTPAAEPKQPQLSPIEQAADARVAKEAAGGFAPHPSPAQYLPFGSFLDEASAGIDAGLNAISGGRIGQPYAEGKAYQNARQRYIDKNASWLEKGAAMAGGVVASAPFGAARIMRGMTLVPEMVNAGLTGVGYGALYGAGEGEGSERVGNAAKGALFGGALGGAAPILARGVGNALNYAANRGARVPAALNGLERGAVNRVADDMTADNLHPVAFGQQAQQLGPNGMLLDMGENLRGSAEVLAQTHGPQLPIVRSELNTRQTAAPGRIEAAVDANLGREMNLPQHVENMRQAFNQQAAPHYDQFHNTSVPVTGELRQVLDDIPASAFNRAQVLARADGHRQQFRLRPTDTPMTPMTGVRGATQEQVPTGLEYDYLKRAVDDLARGAAPGSNEQRIYGNLARRLRTTVDETLSPGAPDESSWAIARGIAGDGIEGREAAEAGSRVFSSTRDPHLVQADLQDMSQLGQQLYRHGARNDLRQVMGRGATNFGPRGDNVARRKLNSEFARENLTQIAGGQRAQNLTRVVDAENRMAESFNQIMANSATARRQAGQSRLPYGAGAPVTTEAPRTVNEMAFSIARKGVNALLNGALGERAGRIMADQARLLTARGIDRDQYVQALLALANHRRATSGQRDAIVQILNAIGQNARQPVIEHQNSAQAN